MRLPARALVALLLLVPAVPAAARAERAADRNRTGAFADIGVGARELALGGAVAAASMNASAAYWNPANLAFLGGREVTATFADLHGLGLARSGFVAFALPDRGGGGALSLLVNHVDLDPDGYTELAAGYSAGRPIGGGLAAGASIRYVGARSTIEDADMNGIDFDLGFTLRAGRLAAALTGRHLLSYLRWHGEEAERIPIRATAGAALALRPSVTLTGDLTLTEESVNLRGAAAGLEAWVAPQVALRGGVRRMGGGGDPRLLFSFGAGVRAGRLAIDYAALLDNEDEALGDTHRGSLSLHF